MNSLASGKEKEDTQARVEGSDLEVVSALLSFISLWPDLVILPYLVTEENSDPSWVVVCSAETQSVLLFPGIRECK